jgi:hypothetical protein
MPVVRRTSKVVVRHQGARTVNENVATGETTELELRKETASNR